MTDYRCDTVKVKNPEDKDGGFMIVNKSDFEANQANPDADPKWEEYKEDPKKLKARGAAGDRRDTRPPPTNASGTYDEPTPTNVKYGNKDATEFENNHGAFVGQSAAELRDALEMDDEPGGLHPEIHEQVEEAEQTMKAALEAANSKSDLSSIRKGNLARRKPKRLASDADEEDADEEDNKKSSAKKNGDKK